jgi:hypothetical protein
MILVKTFLETREAVGRFGWILGYGSVRPIATAIGIMTNRSMYRNLYDKLYLEGVRDG